MPPDPLKNNLLIINVALPPPPHPHPHFYTIVFSVLEGSHWDNPLNDFCRAGLGVRPDQRDFPEQIGMDGNYGVCPTPKKKSEIRSGARD